MRTQLFYSLVVLSVLFFGSCAKEGCTDPDSTNFDIEAKKDDGSCLYLSQATFYLGEGTYDSLNSNGYSSLRLILNTEDLGIVNIANLGDEPDCSNLYTVSNLDLGTNKSLHIPYEVKDENTGKPLFKGEKLIQANSCNGIELKY